LPLTPELRRGDGFRGKDESEVAEGLGKVPHLSLARHVVLLGQETEVVGQSREPLEQVRGLLGAAVGRQSADQPERAGQELPFISSEAIVRVGSGVARDEAVAAELSGYGVDGAGDAVVVPGRNPTRGMLRTLASSSLEP
jgi:hypothetical protein